MPQEVIADSGSAVFALVVALALVALVFALRRRMVATGGGSNDRSATALALRRARTEEEVGRAALAAISPATRRGLRVETVHAAIPGFTLAALLDDCRELFLAVQGSRRTGDTSALQGRMTEGALEVARASGDAAASVGAVRITAVRPVKAAGSSEGSEVQVRVSALVDEIRGTRAVVIDVSELWTLGWSPVTAQWRVVRVERLWRRVLDAPILNLDPVPPPKVARREPDLEQRLAEIGDHDPDAFAATAIGAARSLADAVELSTTAVLEDVATPELVAEIDAQLHRDRAFGARRSISAVHVTETVPCRLLDDGTEHWLSARVSGTRTERLEPGGALPATVTNTPFAQYLTFRRPHGGPWRLAAVDDDDAWVV